MATAVQATKLDDNDLRIEILDTDGRRTKYRRGDQAHPGSEPDLAVDFFHPGEIGLVRRTDGTPRLRQEGPGLPGTVVVAFPNLPQPTPGAATGVVAGWHPEDRFEYQQEPA